MQGLHQYSSSVEKSMTGRDITKDNPSLPQSSPQ